MKFRIIALLLAIFCFVTTLTACDLFGGKENSTEEDAEESATMEVHPTIEQTNYNDTCYMHVFEHINNLYTEKSDSDVLSEALYARQEQLYNYLGVELVGVQTGNLEVYGEAFTTAVKNKDGSVDVLISSAYVGVAEFVIDGYLTRYNDLPQINLEADYWKTDFMQQLMIDDNIYLGYSDFMIFNTFCITFNKEIMSKYEGVLDESVYDSVRNYRWTIDKMISVANLAYLDRTSDGKTADDTYGLTGRQWIPFIGFLQSSNIPLVEQNEKGEFKVAVYNDLYREKTVTLVEKLHSLSQSNSAWFRFRIEDTPEIPLSSGRALMSIQSTGELPGNLQHGLEFGVLPYPLYDENQKSVGYRSFNYDGYICFPAYMRNSDMSAETVEMLSFLSEPVETAYYEKLLGKQVADLPDDREMLEIIWNSVCTDFGLAFSSIDHSLDNNLYMLPTLTHANTTHNVASYVQTYERAANTALSRWMKKYAKTH